MQITNSYIHSSSIVDQGAKVGAGTRVWHWVHVCTGAKIGKNCSLGQNVYIAPNVVIGNNVKIQNNVSVYEGITLGDDVFCGPNMAFTNVYNPRSQFVRKKEFQKTMICQGASLGANCTIICGIEIGQYAFIAAGAVVNHGVNDFALVVGVPASQIGWMNRYGERISIPFGEEGEYLCSHTGDKYLITSETCQLVN